MPDIIASPTEVASTRRDVRVVDVRRDDAYADTHIPGAVHIPFDSFRDPTDETAGKLPTAQTFASLSSEAGISADDQIVAYDGDYGVYASRFLLTAEVFGHDVTQLRLLDGDINTWAQTYETTATVPSHQSPTIRVGPSPTARS